MPNPTQYLKIISWCKGYWGGWNYFLSWIQMATRDRQRRTDTNKCFFGRNISKFAKQKQRKVDHKSTFATMYRQKLRTWAESGSKVGDNGHDGGGRIFPGHPGPTPNAPRENISRKGIPSLRPLRGVWSLGTSGATRFHLKIQKCADIWKIWVQIKKQRNGAL